MEIDLDFYFRYTSEPNSDGWFYEQSITSDGAKLVKDLVEGTISAGGKIKPFKCANGADDCLISSLTLDGVFDAAERQTEMMYFIKNKIWCQGPFLYTAMTVCLMLWKKNRRTYPEDVYRSQVEQSKIYSLHIRARVIIKLNFFNTDFVL